MWEGPRQRVAQLAAPRRAPALSRLVIGQGPFVFFLGVDGAENGAILPYFPTDDERKYQCPGCGGWFIPGMMSCLVIHPPGTCCHKYDTQVG